MSNFQSTLAISSFLFVPTMASTSSFFLAVGLLILSSSFISSLAHTPPSPPPPKKACKWICEEVHEGISPPAQNMSHEAISPPPSVKKNKHKATPPPSPVKKNKHKVTSPPSHESYKATSPPTPTKKHKHKATSPPPYNQSHEATSPPTLTKKNKHKATSPPPHKSHEATSPPTPTKSISPPTPAKNNTYEATSPPAHKSHETTSPPTPTKENNHEAMPPPASNSHGTNSPPVPAQNILPPIPTQNTSPPTLAQNTSPPTPTQNNGHETNSPTPPAKNTSPPTPAQNISPPTPAQNKDHDTNSPPTLTQNTSPPMPSQNSHEANSPPTPTLNNSPPTLTQNKSYDTTLPPPPNSHKAISPPTQNNNYGDSTSSSFYKGTFSYVFAFGESNTDTGNAFRLESHASATSNHNQFCDGRLVIDFLCDALALPTLPPYKATAVNFTFGVNFAIAGSTSLPSGYFGKLENSISLWNGIPEEGVRTQIDWFNKFKIQMGYQDEYSFKAKMADALFWIGGMGLDDYTRVHGLTISAEWLAKNSVASVATIFHAVLNHGARYIVVQGLPPVGCLPLTITSCPLRLRDHMGCAPLANAAIKLHNQILQAELKTFRALHSQATIVYADYWNAYLTILANPAKYNFEEPFKACCGAGGDLNFKIQSICGSPGTSKCKDPSKYINWDGVHLTQAMHQQITNLFINGNFCQPSFAEMIKHKRGT